MSPLFRYVNSALENVSIDSKTNSFVQKAVCAISDGVISGQRITNSCANSTLTQKSFYFLLYLLWAVNFGTKHMPLNWNPRKWIDIYGKYFNHSKISLFVRTSCSVHGNLHISMSSPLFELVIFNFLKMRKKHKVVLITTTTTFNVHHKKANNYILWSYVLLHIIKSNKIFRILNI